MKIFKGSPFEIGIQQGRLYKKNGLNLKNIKVNKKILEGQLKAYQKYYPQLIEEIKGIAVGGNFDEEKILQIYLVRELELYIKVFKIPMNCTIFGVKNKNGVFLGRNLDWLPITEKVMEIYKREVPNYYKFLAVTDMNLGDPEDIKYKLLFYEPIDIINEKGLFAGITFAYGNSWSYGLSYKDMLKLIAETCATVEEVLALFKKVPISFPKNFFIADKIGRMAVVEHNSNKYKVIYPKNGLLIHTNHYLNPELIKEDKVLIKLPYHNTFIRYYEVLQKINFIKDKFNLSNVIKILGDPKSYLCQNHPEIKTIWTLALDMQRRKYKLYTDVVGKKIEHSLQI